MNLTAYNLIGADILYDWLNLSPVVRICAREQLRFINEHAYVI